MSRSKLFNMIKSRGEQPNGRNSFDLSNWHGYTQNFATIQPMKAVYTIPDDYMEVSVSDMCQNINPMNTAAPVSASREMCAYFIPHNFIWHNYNQYQATREDPDSSVMYDKGIGFEPRFVLYDLYFQAFFFFQEFLNTLLVRRAKAFWEVLGTGDVDENSYLWSMENISNLFKRKVYSYPASTRPDDADYLFTSVDIASMRLYNTSGDRIFLGQYNDVPEGSYLDGILNEKVFFDVVGQWKWCDVVRKLDMLGYGNLYPLFYPLMQYTEKLFDELSAKYVEHKSDWNTERAMQELDTYKTYLIGSLRRCVARLKKMCVRLDSESDYRSVAFNTTFELSQTKRVKVYPLFGYNHVFYNMFRNTYRDLDYSPRNYNCDFLNCNTLIGSTITMVDLPVRFLNLECHQWKKDMFTSLLPDMQIGAVQGVSLNFDGDVPISGSVDFTSQTGYDLGRWTTQAGDSMAPWVPVRTHSNGTLQQENPGVGLRHSHAISGTAMISSQGHVTTTSQFDVLALKRAEALQQYYMDLMRAGNRTEDIFKQIYGKAPKSEEHKTPYFVDAVSSPLSINPILATAETEQGENGRLGDIAARCLVNSQPLNFKFSTSDFGVLLFLNFMSVDSAYNSYRIDPHLMNLTPESNFIPQLMNLGYEWLTRESLNNLKLGIQQDQPLGCTPRYIEFKTDVDLVHGNLCDAIDSYSIDDENNMQFDNYEGSLNIWAVTRTDMQQENEITLRNFYQDPRVVNNIFKVFKGDSDPSYESDQFICFSNIKIDAVRQLSELGLPRFV